MKRGDIISTEYWVTCGKRTLAAFTTEEAALKYAEHVGGTVKKIEWKYGGISK